MLYGIFLLSHTRLLQLHKNPNIPTWLVEQNSSNHWGHCWRSVSCLVRCGTVIYPGNKRKVGEECVSVMLAQLKVWEHSQSIYNDRGFRSSNSLHLLLSPFMCSSGINLPQVLDCSGITYTDIIWSLNTTMISPSKLHPTKRGCSSGVKQALPLTELRHRVHKCLLWFGNLWDNICHTAYNPLFGSKNYLPCDR